MHLRPELQPAFKDGRLLILWPFPPTKNRATATLAQQHNRFVGALTDRIFVPHAAPDSRTAALVEELRSDGKVILSITDLVKSEVSVRGLAQSGAA